LSDSSTWEQLKINVLLQETTEQEVQNSLLTDKIMATLLNIFYIGIVLKCICVITGLVTFLLLFLNHDLRQHSSENASSSIRIIAFYHSICILLAKNN